MPCTGAFAPAWAYAAFWCVGSLLSAQHTGAGPADAALSDPQQNFLTAGAMANVGMILYNLTQGTSGPVTAVTANSLTATGVTWNAADDYRIVLIDARQRAAIEHYLDITAADIHAALAASGACDCVLAPWAEQYLSKLNIIEAGIFHDCPCGDPKLSEEKAARYQEWITEQLAQLRDGRLEVCDGATGAEFPAFGAAEMGLTEFSSAKIIVNARDRRTS